MIPCEVSGVKVYAGLQQKLRETLVFHIYSWMTLNKEGLRRWSDTPH